MASVAAAMLESRYPEFVRCSRTLGQQELREPTSSAGSSKRLLEGHHETSRVGVLLLALGLHGPVCSLIPLP